jgi:U3 small nucleolar RNA-associated protein 10
VNLLPTAIKASSSHHTLLAFNAATIHDYLTRTKTLDEGTLAHLLPALIEPLQQRSDIIKDAIVRPSIRSILYLFNLPLSSGVTSCSLHWHGYASSPR